MDFLNDDNITTTITTILTSTVEPSVIVPKYVGYIAIAVSVVFLGSNYIPIKHFETGDGMFFQLMLTTSIWIVGFFVNLIKGYPKFYPLPMLGGFFWSTGQLTVVQLYKLLGIGMGTVLINTVLLVLGWAIARFGKNYFKLNYSITFYFEIYIFIGWFGVDPEPIKHSGLNYAGVILTAISGIFFLFVKPDVKNLEETQPLLVDDSDTIIRRPSVDIIVNSDTQEVPTQFVQRLNPNTKRFIGVFFACLSGVLFAFTFTPALYVEDNYIGAKKDALNYVFSLYTGIYMTTVFYFSIYCLIKKNKPKVYPKVVLPALLSG